MQCNYCGAENPGNAAFCKKCGRRLDGMALCSACGNLTPADGEFCVHCGSNRNAPVYSMPVRFPAVKAAANGKPAGSSAHAVRGEKQRAEEPAEADADEVAAPRTKAGAIMGTIAFVCAAAAALIGIIFVFLIGGVATVTTGGVSASGGPEQTLFYFFGDAYQSINAGSSVSSARLIGAVLGTLCAVAALAGTVIGFVRTVIRFIKILQKKTAKGLLAPAAATYFAYVGGVALFFLNIANKTDISNATTKISASGATVAGIVLGAVFLVAAVVLGVFSRGLRGTVKEFVLHAGSKAAYAVFAFVALGLIGAGAVAFRVEATSFTTTYGISAWFALIAGIGSTQGVYGASLAVGVLLCVAALAFCVFLLIALSRSLADFGTKADKRSTLFMLLSGVFAVVAGVLMIVGSALYTGWRGEGGGYSVSAAVPAVVIVFGVLIVAGVIVYRVLSAKFAVRAPENVAIAQEQADGPDGNIEE